MPAYQDDIAMASTWVIGITRGLIIDTAVGGDMSVFTRLARLTDPKMTGIPLGFISEGHSRNVDLATLEDKI